jgi:hypothetical protein
MSQTQIALAIRTIAVTLRAIRKMAVLNHGVRS